MKPSRFYLPLMLFFICFDASAQQTAAQQRLAFNVDVARFRYNEQQSYLEVYYGIYASLLTYEKVGDRYRGGARLETRLIRKSDGGLVGSQSFDVPVTHTGSADPAFYQTLVGQYAYALDHGQYTLTVAIADAVTPERRDSLSLSVECEPGASGTWFSDLELCSRIEPSTKKDDLFFKNGLEVEPNPTLVFGAKSHPVIYAYAELYNAHPESSYVLYGWLTDIAGRIHKLQRKSRTYTGAQNVEALTTNAAQLPSGKYTQHLLLVGRDSTIHAQTAKVLYVHNPHVKQQAISGISERAAEFGGMRAEELDDEFRKVAYYANDDEKKLYRSLTAEDAKREFLASLWLSLEAGRGAYPPMTRAQYLQNVQLANKRFGSSLQGSRPGWQTDRGRVFLMYGEPDEIERVPSQTNIKPYETWHYYNIESGVYFIFVDRSGFGEMVLVTSTMRGEIQDTQWQQYLR